ncbi:MAG TPA: hypothetical protein VG370_14940 [Chloroflexota bacterium]|nr:hypothetical protein [Chloroflexota bacterium]
MRRPTTAPVADPRRARSLSARCAVGRRWGFCRPRHSSRRTAYSRHGVGEPLFGSVRSYRRSSRMPAFAITRAEARLPAQHQADTRRAPSAAKLRAITARSASVA